MGRQQREKRKKSKASKKNAKAKDEEIPSTPSGEASPPTADPAQNSNVDIEDNVTSVITTGTQEGDRSPVRMSRRRTRTCKGDLSLIESTLSGDPAPTSDVELEGSTTSPLRSARIQEDAVSPSRATRSVKQSSKGEVPLDEPTLPGNAVSNSGAEGEDKTNSSVQTPPSTARIQDDSGSPIRMTRRITRSCKVAARISILTDNGNEHDGKASEASSTAEEIMTESLQQQLEATVQALQDVSPTKEPLKRQGNKASPAAVSGTVLVESLDHSPNSLDLSKLSPHSNTASPVVCLERCSESDILARQRVHSPYEALGFSQEEEDLLAAQKPMPLCRKLVCVEELPSSEAVRLTVNNQMKNPKISEHLGKRNGCRRKISPSSTAFKIQSLDEGRCTEGVSNGASSGSADDVVVGESASLCTESEPPSSQLGTPALPSARSKRFVGRGEKLPFPGSDNDEAPCRKLLILDSCDLGNEEGVESQSVLNCSNTNYILSHKSDTKFHEQENCCRCADANDGDKEFSGSSRHCNCRVQSSFSYQSENLQIQNEAFLHLVCQPGDSTASVSENACGRSGSCYTQSLVQFSSNINSSSLEHEDDIHVDDPRDLSLKDSLVPGVMKGVPDDSSSTSRRNGIAQEDYPRDGLRDISSKCSSVYGDVEDIHSTVNDYSYQDNPKDSSLACSLVPGELGVSDDGSSVNTSGRNNFSQEECCQNDREDQGCFRSNHSRSSVNVPLAPLVQHEGGSLLLGGGATSKSSRKNLKSSRCHQDNSENSDSDRSSSRTASRNLVDQCGTNGHQEDQDSDVLQGFNGENTGKVWERSRSVSPQNFGHCSRTLPLSTAFSVWKSRRSASSDAKLDLGEQTDENFSKYNASCREKQDTLTDTASSELSSLIGSESLSSQDSKVHSSPSKHKKSYFEGRVNGKFPSERGLSCSVSPKSVTSYHCFEEGRKERENVSEDHIGTERISWKTDGSGSKLSLNRHRSERHSALRHEGSSDGISVEAFYISDVNSHSSISLDHSVHNKLQSQVSNYKEKQIVMNSEDHQNEKVPQKINHNVSKPLNSDVKSKSNVPSTEQENCHKNKVSAKRDQRHSQLNSKPNSESHIRSHEPSLKLSNGFDLALDESSKYSRGGKMNSHERKNKKQSLRDNHKTDSEPGEKEKSTSSYPHSRSSSERKSDDVRSNKRVREDVKDISNSKKRKLSSVRLTVSSKDGEQYASFEGKSSVPNEFDKDVCESHKISDYVKHSKMVDSSCLGRNLGSEKRRSNVAEVIGSSEVGGKDERNKCKRTGKNDMAINTEKQSVSCNVADTVLDKSDEQPALIGEQVAEDGKQERAEIPVVNTTTAGESQLHNTSPSGQSTVTGSEIVFDNIFEQLLGICGTTEKLKEKFLSKISSLDNSSSIRGTTEEVNSCPEEREQFNECSERHSPKELGQTYVRNLNNAFEKTDIGPSSVSVPGTKDSVQEGESSEVVKTDKMLQPTNGKVEDPGSSKQQNLGLSESYSNVRNCVRYQEAESQSDTLSNSIKPLKVVGNCYKEIDDNKKMNSSATSLLKIRSKPISCDLVVNNSVDRSSKQPRADVKRNSCNANLTSSQRACVVEDKSTGDSGPSEELSPKLQGSPKMRTRSQKTPTPNRVNNVYESVLTALHLVKSPHSRDGGDRTVSGLHGIENPARSGSESSGLNGNKGHLSESKEVKKVPEANLVVQKPASPFRKRLKRNWIVKTTETPPVSTPPACSISVPSSCSSLGSSPSRGDVPSSPSPNVTTSVQENASQDETFPLAQPDTSRKSGLSSTLNLPSSEDIRKIPSVLERRGACEESPFKIPSHDKSQKNVPVSSKTQEVSPSRTKPSSPVKTQSRVLNIPVNRRPTSLSSTANPVIRPLHPRITAPPQTNEQGCDDDDDDDDAISLFAESADLDIEDILKPSLSTVVKRPVITMSNLSTSCAPRHNFVRRQTIEMPPAEPEPEPGPELDPEDVQTEMQEMEVEENNQEETEMQEMEVEENNQEEEEEEDEVEMEVSANMVDDCEGLDDIEDDKESVFAELQSHHSVKSLIENLSCNNSEQVKLCVDTVNLNPFSNAGQDSTSSAVTPAHATRVSAVSPAQATRLSPTTRVSAVTPAQASRVSAEITRPSLAEHLQTSRPVTSAQANRSCPVQKSAAPSAQSNALNIGPELVDYRVPKFLTKMEKQHFLRMCRNYCFSYLKNGVCFKKMCMYRHDMSCTYTETSWLIKLSYDEGRKSFASVCIATQYIDPISFKTVPLLERRNDVLKMMKWSAGRGFMYMSSFYADRFIQIVCDTCRIQGMFRWNGILGCLIHAGRPVEDAIRSVIEYVKVRREYFAPVLEMLVKHKKLLSYRDILWDVDKIPGFEYPLSVVKYLLTEPKTKQDLSDITYMFIRSESLQRGLCRVERTLITRYMSGLKSAGLTRLVSELEGVLQMSVLDYNKSRTFVSGRDGLLPIPNQFRPSTEELFKVPSMSVKESLTQAKSNLRGNLLSRKLSLEKQQQLMESSDIRTPVRQTYSSMTSKKFGGVITSEFDLSRKLVAEPEAVEHELPRNGIVTRLVSPRTLLEDQSCNFSSYPRNVSQQVKGLEVYDHSAGSNSSNNAVLLDRAGNDKPFHVPTLGTPMEQETQLSSAPYSPAFSGSSSSQLHFSLSSLSQEGQGSPFSSRNSAGSGSNSSKSMTGQLSPVRLSRDDRRRMEDLEPSRADLQERLSVKSRLGGLNSSPMLEESQWNPGSVWEVSPMVGERDIRTRFSSRRRDSDINRLPEWKLLNMEQDLAAPIGHCSPVAVEESVISLRKVLLSGDALSALNILHKFCAHDMKYSFAREAFLTLRNNKRLSSMMFGRLILQSDREQKSLPLLHLLCTIGVNLMFDLMDKGIVNEARMIYTFLKDRDIHPAPAMIFQERMSPCRIMLKCCQICMNVKDYDEAKNIVLQNDLQYSRPEKWKVQGIKEDSGFRVEVVRSLLAMLANDGPSVDASELLIAIIHAQSKKFMPIDFLKYTNRVMLGLLKDDRRTEAIDLYVEIETVRNCLEAPTYRWLLIILEQENRSLIAHRLYSVACRMSVYPLINWNSRPLHVKIFSNWLHEEILVVIRDFLHQLKQGDQLKPSDDPAHLNFCIYIETQLKPQQSQQKPYPLILSQVNDSIDDVKQRLFGVLRHLRLQAASIPHDRTVQIKPESLAERLKSPLF